MKPLVLDLESNGKDVRWDPDFRGLGLAYASDTEAGYIAYGHLSDNTYTHDQAVEKLLQLTEEYDTFIGHNFLKFDISAIIKSLGVDLWDRNVYDTMLMVHWLHEGMPVKSLDACGKKFVGEGKVDDPRMKHYTEGSLGWGLIPRYIIEPYAIQDAKLTLKLFKKLWPSFCEEFGSNGF